MSLRIQRIVRQTVKGRTESLSFGPGLNIVSGPANSGKTVWLNMIDYVFGETSTFEKSFGAAITDEYSSISVDLILRGKPVEIHRTWPPHKIDRTAYSLFCGEGINQEKISNRFLRELGFPMLFFPRGAAGRQVMHPLTWRMMMRHFYRQQRFWSDIADKQPTDEVRACILQFVGLAEEVLLTSQTSMSQKRDQFDKLTSLLDASVSASRAWARGFSSSQNQIDEKNISKKISELEARSEALREEGRRLKLENPGAIDELVKTAFLRGRVVEQLRSAKHLQDFFSELAGMRGDASRIQHEMSEIENEIYEARISQTTDEKLQRLVEHMNTYLSILNESHANTWKHGPVDVDDINNRIVFHIGPMIWSQVIGGSDTLVFLLAFHYALFALVADPDSHVPGFAMVDLPADFSETSERFQEQLFLEPFAALFSKEGFSECQLIVAGNGLKSVCDCRLIELGKVYLPASTD